MELLLEVSEAEIKSALGRKVRLAIVEESNNWRADAIIKASIKKHWTTTVDKLVQECLEDTPALKKKIMVALEAKVKAKLKGAL